VFIVLPIIDIAVSVEVELLIFGFILAECGVVNFLIVL
jgi:hypothetical protein